MCTRCTSHHEFRPPCGGDLLWGEGVWEGVDIPRSLSTKSQALICQRSRGRFQSLNPKEIFRDRSSGRIRNRKINGAVPE